MKKQNKNLRWSKLVDLIVNFFSVIVMLYAVALAIAREVSWPFIVIAAVVCPLWIIAARKLFWQEKPIVSWCVRGVILIGCYVFLGVCIRHFPYNRCHPVVARDNFQKNFENNIRTDEMEYQGMEEISKKIVGDYMELTTIISYQMPDGTIQTREMTMYFDRLNGKYYGTKEEMDEYRKKIRELTEKS